MSHELIAEVLQRRNCSKRGRFLECLWSAVRLIIGVCDGGGTWMGGIG